MWLMNLVKLSEESDSVPAEYFDFNNGLRYRVYSRENQFEVYIYDLSGNSDVFIGDRARILTNFIESSVGGNK